MISSPFEELRESNSVQLRIARVIARVCGSALSSFRQENEGSDLRTQSITEIYRAAATPSRRSVVEFRAFGLFSSSANFRLP